MAGSSTVGRKKAKNPATRADKAAPDLKDRQDEFFTRFSRNVQARRHELGLSQAEVAFKAGLARAYVNRVENDAEPLALNLYAAFLIAKALKTTVDRLCRPNEGE